jgi:hypothetical protein
VTCLLYPGHVMPQVFGAAKSGRTRGGSQRLRRLRELQREDEELVASVARDAFANGDLELQAGLSLEETLLALHGLTQGILERVGTLPAPAGISDPRPVLRRAGGRLLDGLGWRPLSSEWDYRATMARIYTEVFPPGLLAARGLIEEGLPEARGLKTAAG